MTVKVKELTPQQDAFAVHYTTIGSDTYSHASKSAEAAGYAESSARNSATALLRSPEVRQRITELNTENMKRNGVTVDSVLTNLAHDRQLARDKGDVSSAVRVDEIEAKFMGMLVDRQMNVDTEQQQQLTEAEVFEAKRLAAIRLQEAM
jgi:phage terminase small subunit